jgi:RHS repeat-associated protein
VYDGLGRREKKTINGSLTEFLYDGVNPVQETSGATVLANMLTGLGIDEFFTRTDVPAAVTSHFLPDALGSAIALADAAGAVQTEYTYEPFGRTTVTGASDTNPFQYTGRENEGTGLYYYRARYHHPQLQRFISEDPIEFAGGDINLYAYVGNSPIDSIDPSGEAIKVPLPAGCRPNPPSNGGRKDPSESSDTGEGNPLFKALWDFLCESIDITPGPGIAKAPAAVAGRALKDILRASPRTFRRLLESLEGQAARHGGATRTIEETRRILDEAIQRGYRPAPRGVETDWIGGRHINLLPPGGKPIHFPLPPGFTP